MFFWSANLPPLSVQKVSFLLYIYFLSDFSYFVSEPQFILDKLTSFYSNVLSLFFCFMLLLLMDI